MSYAVKYYRDRASVERYRRNGVIKEIGFVLGRDRYFTRDEAEKLARHINASGSKPPAHVVASRDVPNANRFLEMKLWVK